LTLNFNLMLMSWAAPLPIYCGSTIVLSLTLCNFFFLFSLGGYTDCVRTHYFAPFLPLCHTPPPACDSFCLLSIGNKSELELSRSTLFDASWFPHSFRPQYPEKICSPGCHVPVRLLFCSLRSAPPALLCFMSTSVIEETICMHL